MSKTGQDKPLVPARSHARATSPGRRGVPRTRAHACTTLTHKCASTRVLRARASSALAARCHMRRGGGGWTVTPAELAPATARQNT
jgi:hypothetical protein